MRTNTRKLHTPDPFTTFGELKDRAYEHAETINWKEFIREVGRQFRNITIIGLVFAALLLVIIAGQSEINRLEQRIVTLEKLVK